MGLSKKEVQVGLCVEDMDRFMRSLRDRYPSSVIDEAIEYTVRKMIEHTPRRH